jgi:hypothetical protein
MHLMEAIRSLQHGHIHFFLIFLSDQLITKFTDTVFFCLLHLFVVGLSSFPFTVVHEVIKIIICIIFFLLLLNLIAGRRWDHIHIIVKFVLFKYAFLLFVILPRLITYYHSSRICSIAWY